MERKAGVLMHISSLPGSRGIGSLGKAAYDFVDFLSRAGFSLWQVLPLCPTSYGDSPYQSPSVMAGNPYFIDLDMLCGERLLKKDELPKYEFGAVDFGAVYYERYATLKKAYERFIKNPPADYDTFKKQNEFWLDDFATFMAIKDAHGGKAWETWEDEYKFRTADLSEYSRKGEFYRFTQYEFFKQWRALKAYANEKGIKIVGDMPIYVAYDSVDVWANPEQFLLNPDLSRKDVAGVPPDYFCADGQLWGNPIYDWEYMKKQNYSWWVTRMKAAFDMYDIVRIDHFRAFADYYAIPDGMPNAKIGEWRAGPGLEFFDAINAALNNPPIIAEDLGELHQCVKDLLKSTGLPGMKVMQFAFDGNPENDFYYTNYPTNCVAYPGTHDNDTTRGWFESLTADEKSLVTNLIGEVNENDIAKVFTEKLLSSKADTVIIPMQDILNLPSQARMNTPSTLGGNWAWRSKDLWSKQAPSIRALIEKYDRL